MSAASKLHPAAAVVAAALLIGLAVAPLPASAQEEPAAEEGAGEQPESGEDELLAPLPEFDDIDEILGGEDAILSGGGYTYDSGERRDPFKSLLEVSDQPTLRGPRPEGIPGLLIDEVLVSGIFRTSSGFVAQVQAADRQKSYLIKVGDELFDGDVVSISMNEVVFKQNVQDPTALKPFREVVKVLNP